MVLYICGSVFLCQYYVIISQESVIIVFTCYINTVSQFLTRTPTIMLGLMLASLFSVALTQGIYIRVFIIIIY